MLKGRRTVVWLLLASAGLLSLAPARAAAGVLGKFSKKPQEQYVPGEKWEAFVHDDQGNTRALRQPVEKNDDQDWLFLTFTDYKGPRNRLAVMEVENKTASVEQGGVIGALIGGKVAEVPVAAMEELLTTSLFNTHRFEMTERKVLQSVLAEQDFGKSGRVADQSAAKIGKVLGADYLIFAAVNEWTPNKSRIGGGGGGLGGKVLGMVGGGKSTAEVAMSFRIVDATSGAVLFADTVRAEAGSWGISFAGIGGPGTGGGGFEKNSPIGYAIQSCINKAAYKIAMSLKERAWSGTVIKVEGGKIYINAGSNKGMQPGMKLVALAKGKALVDPDTGASLGEDTEAIGNLQVTTVKDNFAIATVVQGCTGLKAGDRVEVAEGGL